MPDGLAADMRGISATLKTFDRKFASSVRKQIRAAVTKEGADIVAAVRSAASWSKPTKQHGDIPSAVSIRPNFSARSAGVRVVVSRTKAPHARVLEMGNQGGSDGASTFRHPVFQRLTGGKFKRAARGTAKRWVTQQKHPFFFSTTEKMTPEVEKRFMAAIDQVVRDAIDGRG